jgi:uncharacterized protein (DUF2252 family)
MAEITAWGHLRGCSRFGAASVEALQRYVAGDAWGKKLAAVATDSCARTLAQWRTYCQAYDRGDFNVEARPSAAPDNARKM